MSATPFLLVCLLFFGGLASIGLLDRAQGDPLDRALCAFFLFMTVWAAGLLLQPITTH